MEDMAWVKVDLQVHAGLVDGPRLLLAVVGYSF